MQRPSSRTPRWRTSPISSSTGAGRQSARRVEPSPGHRGRATGLVLFLLVGRGAGGFAGARRLRRRQQLAGRVRVLAPRSGPASRRDRMGAMVGVGRATALAEGAGMAIKPAEGFRTFETLLRYDRPYSGYAPLMGTPWLTSFAQRSRFAEAFGSLGQGLPDRASSSPNCRPCRARNGRRQSGGWYPARSACCCGAPSIGSPALRLRPGFAGKPGIADPHRNRDGRAHQSRQDHHGSRLGGPFVRRAGWVGSGAVSVVTRGCRYPSYAGRGIPAGASHAKEAGRRHEKSPVS